MRTPAPLSDTDTICAPATPPGEGAVGIVRLSGPDAVALAARHFRTSAGERLEDVPTHSVRHGFAVDGAGQRLDEALAIVMRAPRSYTREDVVEIQCHGGGASVRAVLAALLASGCRMAEPGEFTRRAFLNGRIDLAQAEAVLEVIHARTDLQQRLAQRQLAGALSHELAEVAETLRDLAARMEAAIDFPDEDTDLPDTVRAGLADAARRLGAVVAGARSGVLLREGVRLAILGRPNVGKSSLLNRLLGYDRAIVADLPGTTRDVVDAEMVIGGVRFVVQDTAGIRAPADAVEAEGVARSRSAAAGADLRLLVLDGSAPLCDDDRELLARHGGPGSLVAVNKCDLPTRASLPAGLAAIPVSARGGAGLDALKAALAARVAAPGHPLEHAFLVTLRQQAALEQAARAAAGARDGLAAGAYPELVAADLRAALDALGEITGETTTDDLLDRIFSRFCIGK
ncbi:MAG: tRNA uridine-5-carboxymethylaminomethyl(34) synthesis GTPase MnmE [Nitrospirae bacterium]|nr:tRNA uridine-5-carboxymethylaminomethyl(34) synthesis GTPase MnmE [Nitrospirota bacterium]